MDQRFTFVNTSTVFEREISELFKSRLIKLKDAYPDYYQKISFTPCQTEISSKSLGYKRFKQISLQRSLLDTALHKLKPFFLPNRLVIDVAGGGYDDFFGIPKENYAALNIDGSSHSTFVEDAEGECRSVASNQYDIALCLNYLLLAENPGRVVANMHRFIKKEGVAIFDFIGLSYWYLGGDGRHWHSYNPYSISKLIIPHFSDYVIIPVGNWFQATCNYYAKQHSNNLFIRRFLTTLGVWMGGFDRSPMSAIHYVVVAKK